MTDKVTSRIEALQHEAQKEQKKSNGSHRAIDFTTFNVSIGFLYIVGFLILACSGVIIFGSIQYYNFTAAVKEHTLQSKLNQLSIQENAEKNAKLEGLIQGCRQTEDSPEQRK